HNEYGIYAPDIAIPSAVDTIMVDKELHLEQLASDLNTDIEEIKILNPQYKRLVVPAYTQPYPIRLRMPDVIKYLDMKDSVYAYQYDRYFTPMKVYAGQFTGNPVASCESKKVYHYVKNGETISKIAAKYGLSIYELKKMNKLSSNYIKVKQRLLVGYEY
ncbi:MAG: LysM peptidoglycan-binding domain-containing protein, partial [Bacteroidales bacterium]